MEIILSCPNSQWWLLSIQINGYTPTIVVNPWAALDKLRHIKLRFCAINDPKSEVCNVSDGLDGLYSGSPEHVHLRKPPPLLICVSNAIPRPPAAAPYIIHIASTGNWVKPPLLVKWHPTQCNRKTTVECRCGLWWIRAQEQQQKQEQWCWWRAEFSESSITGELRLGWNGIRI